MKLLLDENLSSRLVEQLGALFPETKHVSGVGLESADDMTVWSFARDQGFVIVSKDSDFHQRSFLFGAPPKVIWLRLGNCTTREIADLLTTREPEIQVFGADPTAAFLVISR